MKKYFLYELKKNLLPLACFFLFCVVMYVVPVSVQDYSSWNSLASTTPYEYYQKPNLYCGNLSAALGIMSALVPVFMFRYKMSRRSADMYYALPIGRTKIFAVKFLLGLLLMYVSYTAAFLWGFAVVAVKVRNLFLIWYLYFYLASLIPAFVVYAVSAFIFTRANTLIDGIIAVFGALGIFAAALFAAEQLFPKMFVGISGGLLFPFRSLTEITNRFGGAIVDGVLNRWDLSPAASGALRYNTVCSLAGMILWTALACVATVAMFLTEKNCKAENCGQRSESVFCYKVQLPAYAAILCAGFFQNVVLLCAILFGLLVMSVIYKRSIKIGWIFALVMVSCAAAGLICGAVSGTVLT